MIQTLIVEDEVHAANRLRDMLGKLDEDISVLTVLDSIESTVKWLNTHPAPDLIFLDIQLADGRSFEIFEQVNLQSPIIFTTAYDEFALKAFSLHSIDYLLKPLKPEALRESIKKYRSIKNYFSNSGFEEKMQALLTGFRTTEKIYKNRFLVNKGDSSIPVVTEDIAYFYAEDKEVFLVNFQGKQYFINYSLDTLVDMLDPKLFYRANRQFIIAAKAVERVRNYFNYKLKVEVRPRTEKEIIISRAKVGEFRNWLNT